MAASQAANPKPLVTVVMPTFNRGELLAEAVRSVIAQTYQHWELILVDDGSTDGSIAPLEALDEPRLRIVRQPHCGRVARLRNLGAAAGSGDYIAFLDSDDLWLPRRLERQFAGLAGSGAAWCCSNAGVIDRSGKRIPLKHGRFEAASGRIARALLLEETAAFVITLLVPRSLFDRVGGFDEQFLRYEDLDLAVRLAETADAIALGDVLALNREHSGRMTRHIGFAHEQAALVYEKALKRGVDPDLAPLLRKRRAAHLTGAARERLERGNIGASLRLAGRSILEGGSPLRVGRALAGGALRLVRRR